MEAVWKGNENGVVPYVWLNCLLAKQKATLLCYTGPGLGRNENVKVVGFEPPAEWRVWAFTLTLLHVHYTARLCAQAE